MTGRPDKLVRRRLTVILAVLTQAGKRGATKRQILEAEAQISPVERAPTTLERQFFRDIARLRKAGWKIKTKDDRYYLSVVDHRLGFTFSAEERVQLLRAAQRAGIGQLYEDLGNSQDGAEAALSVELATLRRAIDKRRMVSFSFLGRKREVDPLELVYRHGGWHLVGFEVNGAPDKQHRAFDLKWIEGIERGQVGSAPEPPEGLEDALDVLLHKRHPPLKVIVACDPNFTPDAVRSLGSGGWTLKETGPEDVLEFMVTNRWAFVRRLVELGQRARLEGPAEIRQELAKLIDGQGK